MNIVHRIKFNIEDLLIIAELIIRRWLITTWFELFKILLKELSTFV